MFQMYKIINSFAEKPDDMLAPLSDLILRVFFESFGQACKSEIRKFRAVGFVFHLKSRDPTIYLLD